MEHTTQSLFRGWNGHRRWAVVRTMVGVGDGGWAADPELARRGGWGAQDETERCS